MPRPVIPLESGFRSRRNRDPIAAQGRLAVGPSGVDFVGLTTQPERGYSMEAPKSA